MKALIWKEFRENVRWMPVGLFVMAVACYMAHPSRNSNLLLATELLNYFAIVTPLLAFALGVVQSYRDLQPAAGAYLNHRSVTASDVFLAKVFSGFVLFMSSVIVPVVVLAAWVAYRGMWFYPMRPAQVVPGLVFAMISFAMHPAAMLMMSRSASWWGTRLFPLVPAGAALVPFYGYLQTGGLYWASVCFVIAVPTLAWMIAISRQGWQELSSDPPALSVNASLSRCWLLPAYMLVGSVLCLIFALTFSISVIENAYLSNVYVSLPYVTLAVEEESDDLWLVTQQVVYNPTVGSTITTIGGEAVMSSEKINLKSGIAKGRTMLEFGTFAPLQNTYHRGDGFFTTPASGTTTLLIAYDFRGYLLAYEAYPQMRWAKTIAAAEVHEAGELTGTPFQRNPLDIIWAFAELANAGYPTPLVDSTGLSFIDNDPISIRKVIEMQIDCVALVRGQKNGAPRLIVRSGMQLHEFKLVDQSGTDDWYIKPESGSNAYNRVVNKDLKLHAELMRKFTLPTPIGDKENLRLAWTPKSLFVSEPDTVSSSKPIVYRLAPNETSEAITFSVDADSRPKTEEIISVSFTIAGMIPGVVFLIVVTVSSYLFVIGEVQGDPFLELVAHPIATSNVLISFIVITALSVWLVRRASDRRGLSRRQTTLWLWAVPLLGLAAPLSIIAIYRLVHREPCPQCDGSRRVDTATCEHCGAQWEPPASERIEISDRQLPIRVEPMTL